MRYWNESRLNENKMKITTDNAVENVFYLAVVEMLMKEQRGGY